MNTLFYQRDLCSLNLLVLPTYCVAGEESRDLAAKREARLKWMREQGMTYLGDPIDRCETPSQWRRAAPSVRLVSFRGRRSEPEAEVGEDRMRRVAVPAGARAD